MAHGVKIVNDHGTILIDDTFHNIAIVQQGTVTIPGGGSVQIPAAAPGEQVAIRSSAICACLGSLLIAAPGTVVSWYRFGRPTAQGQYGFRVRDAAGNVTFDSSFKYARVAGSHTAKLSTFHDIPLPAGRIYAVIMAREAIEQQVDLRPFEPLQPAPPYAFDATVRNSGSQSVGNVVTIGWVQTMTYDNLGQPIFTPPDYFIDNEFTAHIIDVTGY